MMAVGRFLRRLPWMVVFAGYFLWELMLANARVASDVASPGLRMRAGIVRVSTNCETDVETMLLANAISMTPGTLSIDVAENDRDLYVHTLYVEPLDDFLEQIAAMERHLLKATR